MAEVIRFTSSYGRRKFTGKHVNVTSSGTPGWAAAFGPWVLIHLNLLCKLISSSDKMPLVRLAHISLLQNNIKSSVAFFDVL